MWAYNFGQCNFNNFIETHCRAIVIRKPGNVRKWYLEDNMTESKRLLMGDKRCQESKYKGMIPFGTVWGLQQSDFYWWNGVEYEFGHNVVTEPLQAEERWGRVQGNNKERRKGHPNQLPERYVERAIKAYTQKGDTMFVPFCGSGTEITVAKHLERDCIATDVSGFNVNSASIRLETGALL